MMLRPIFLVVVLTFSCFVLTAQQICGTEEVYRDKMNDPDYRLRYNSRNKAIDNAQAQRKNARTQAGNTVYRIPVVFHILHKGEPVGTGTNLSDEAIYLALKTLNERYRSVPGTVSAQFGSVDNEIEFVLAVRDPDGNCTDGIDRVDMTGNPDYMTYGVGYVPAIGESQFKWPTIWDSNYYCNIWTVSTITLPYPVAGYAFMAASHGTDEDGIVLMSEQIVQNSVTLTHEMGHYLDLYHTFEGDFGVDGCPVDNDCAVDGDKVCDTAPHNRNSGCALAPNPCVPGEDNTGFTYNIMSYSCSTKFTEGQKSRLRNTVVSVRSSLLEENGNMAMVPPVAPEVDFVSSQTALCAGSTVQFWDRSSCVPNTMTSTLGWNNITFAWTITNNLGFTATSAEQNPAFQLTETGPHDVTLTVTTPDGTKSLTKKNMIAVGDPPVPSCAVQMTRAEDCENIDYGFGIYEMTLNTLHHRSGSTCEDIASGLTDANGYGDFSCTQTTVLEPDTDYEIGIVRGGAEVEWVLVYIDFDNNGITNDDIVVSGDYVPGGAVLTTLPFRTPPTPVFDQVLRMRIVTDDVNQAPPESCGLSVVRGQIHDFGIIFSNPLPLAKADHATTREDQAISFSIVANDVGRVAPVDPRTIDLDPVEPSFQYTKITPEGKWTGNSRGIMTFEPAPDFNGTASITYTINDEMTAVSLPAAITVIVSPVNDAPFFVKGADEELVEDAGPQYVTNWATGISPGPPDEAFQELTFAVANNNTALFSVQPSISAGGELTYTSAPDAFGTATVEVLLKDDGGVTNDGVDTFTTQTFTINVMPVNDPPVVVNLSAITTQGVSVSGDLSEGDMDIDGSITYAPTPVSGPAYGQIIIQAEGTFIYTPDEDFGGEDIIVINVCDDGEPVLCVTKTLTIDVQLVTAAETDVEQIEVYPNPSTGTFRLSVPFTPRAKTVKVSDALGRIIYQSDVEQEALIDLSQHARGIYLLEIGGSESKFVRRIFLK